MKIMTGGFFVGESIARMELQLNQSPLELFTSIVNRSSDRKFMLCSVASARELLQYLPKPAFATAIDWLEKYADSLVDKSDDGLERTDWNAEGAMFDYQYAGMGKVELVDFTKIVETLPKRITVARQSLRFNDNPTDRDLVVDIAYFIYECFLLHNLSDFNRYQRCKYHNVAYMHDIFTACDCPHNDIAAWRNANTVPIAAAMYDSRDFTAAPILADALEDAGCTEAAILDHLCDPAAVHVRGCWAVDLVLGKT